MSAESEREALLGESRQILIRAALVEIVEAEQRGTSGGQGFGNEVVLALARHGAPYRALLQLLGFEGGSAEASDPFLAQLRAQPGPGLRRTAEALRQRGFDLLRRLASLPRVAAVPAAPGTTWSVDQASPAGVVEPAVVAALAARSSRAARDLASSEGIARAHESLARIREGFFRAVPADGTSSTNDEAANGEPWEARLELHDASAGGLHVATSVLRGLPSFVKTMSVVSTGHPRSVLAANLRTKPWRVPVAPSSDPYTWTTGAFDEDLAEDLARLRLDGLPADRAAVFRVDAAEVGQRVRGDALSPGQHYRVLIPPALDATPLPSEASDAGSGWRCWNLWLPRTVPAETRSLLESLGLGLGTTALRASWVAVGAREFRENTRGERYPCFLPDDKPAVEIEATGLDATEAVTVFVAGPGTLERQALPPGRSGCIGLGGLTCGEYVLEAITESTAVTPVRLPFAVVNEVVHRPRAVATAVLRGQLMTLEEGRSVVADLRALAGESGGLVLELPPCWPVELRWSGLRMVSLETVFAEQDGSLDMATMLEASTRPWATERAGDLVLDAGDLGRLTLQHEVACSPLDVCAQVLSLLRERRATLDVLRGDFALLRSVWLEPLAQVLGYALADFAPGSMPMSVAGTHAARLESLVREGDGTTSIASTALILGPRGADLERRSADSLRGWATAVCKRHGLARALVADGLRWNRVELGRSATRPTIDLSAVTDEAGPEALREFWELVAP